jgi:phosphoglycerate dehydrogenase-like enzyme
MQNFRLLYTGDYLDKDGRVAYGDIGLDALERHPWIECGFLMDQKPDGEDYWERLYSLEVKPHHLRGANGLVIFRPWVKAQAFAEGARDLVVIGRAGAGYDKIDIAACTANDVAVFNAPDTLTHATASAALLFMLALAKRLPEQERLARTGCWNSQSSLVGQDLTGLTLSIVGFGRSGAELARLVKPFDMRVLAYSTHADQQQAADLGVTLVPSLERLLPEADFVSLHSRLTADNRRSFGERQFRLMKPSAYFINIARGELVDQAILIRALSERWIAGAGLDVFEAEPLPPGDPLLTLDNVILTPHWLASTQQAARATVAQMVNGMLNASQGLIPDNVLNTAVLDRRGFRAKLAHFVENGRESY